MQLPTSHFELEWQFTVQPYLKNAGVLRCPSDKTPYDMRPPSYIYNAMLGWQRQPFSEAALEKPAEVVMLWDGHGPSTHSGAAKPPLIGGQAFPKSMFREYTNWGNEARWLADPKLGMPRHHGGGHALYVDQHVKWLRYGQGSTPAERTASVERAFPYTTAVAPAPPSWLKQIGARWAW